MMRSINIRTRANFVAAARSYVGVPFRHQGRDRRGVDCLGLLVCAARDVGIAVVDNLAYNRTPDYEIMRAGLLDHFDTIPRTRCAPGDLYWIKWNRAAYPMHLAIITSGDGEITHADGLRARSVTAHALPDDWRAHIVTGLRFKRWQCG